MAIKVPMARAQQQSSVSVSVPAGALEGGLLALGKQANLKLVYASALTAGKQTGGVSGQLAPQAAVEKLLAGTGLSYSFTGANTVRIFDPSAADNAGATVEGAIALDTIDVSGGSTQSASDLPYQTPDSSAYISGDQLRRIEPTTAGDMFKGTPGVISGSSNTGGAVDVNIRGAQGQGRVKVMVEGTQQSNTTYRSYQGSDNRSYVDPDMVSSISIEKGPVSGPYGAGVMGGVVNMQTLGADDVLLDGRTVGVRIRGGSASNFTDPAPGKTTNSDSPDFLTGDNAFGSVAMAMRKDDVEAVAAFSKREHGNYFAGTHGDTTYPYTSPKTLPYTPVTPGLEVTNTSEDVESKLAKLKLTGDNGRSFEIGYIGMDGTFGYAYPYYLGSWPNTQFGYSQVESDRYFSKYRWNPTDNDLIHLGFNLWATTLQSCDPSSATDPSCTKSVTDGHSHGGELWNASVLDVGNVRHKLEYGASYASETLEVATSVDGTKDTFGTYATYTFQGGDLLEASAGLKYDYYRIEGLTSAGRSEKEDSAVSPNFRAALMPFQGVQLFASYAKGMRGPSMAEYTGSFAGFVPNPNIEPEQSTSKELGLNLLYDDVVTDKDKFRAKLVNFSNFYENYISSLDDTAAAACGPTGRTRCFGNIGELTLKGYEVAASYDHPYLFADASLSYYTQVKRCDQLNGCDGQWTFWQDYGSNYNPPKLYLTATLGAKLFDERLIVGARLKYIDVRAQPRINQSFYFTTVWPEATVYDAFGSFKVNENLTIDASIENIGDHFYIDPLAVARLPAPGRTVRMGATSKF